MAAGFSAGKPSQPGRWAAFHRETGHIATVQFVIAAIMASVGSNNQHHPIPLPAMSIRPRSARQRLPMTNADQVTPNRPSEAADKKDQERPTARHAEKPG